MRWFLPLSGAGIFTALGNMRRPRYLHIGDSLVQGSGAYSTSATGTRDLTLTIAMASGGVLEPIGNGGIGGQTSPMIAARIVRALALRPDVVGVTMGSNDYLVLASSAYIANSLDVVKRAMDGARVAWYVTTIPPNNNVSYQANIAAINAIVKSWSAANGVLCVDVWSYLQVGGAWPTNYTIGDGTHWNSLASFLASQFIWSQISQFFPPNNAYSPGGNDPSNLLFAPIANTGLPSSNSVKDPLFINHRSFTQNSFTVDLPYLFGTHYGSGTNPTVVSSVYDQPAGVKGNRWTLTLSPNGAGGYTASNGGATYNRLQVAMWQGRKLRIGFKLGMSGFGVDNTLARLAGNSDAPASGFGITFSCYNQAGSVINTIAFSDPVDTTGTVNGPSGAPVIPAAPMRAQALFGQQNATPNQWCVDHPLLPVVMFINVPVGAVALETNYVIAFTAAAVSPVSVSLAEMTFTDAGPAEWPETPVTLPLIPNKTLTAAYTIGGTGLIAEAMAIGVWRCDATAGAFAVTLPNVQLAAGRTLTFLKIDAVANAITFAGGTINGTAPSLGTQWQTVRLYSNGSTWDQI